ncbi:DUF58 domain-containing protein [Alicyclobacillus ferrooxydans]|uniref:DUF58 domain-containing protein n=1 Tax=Alicyclobacillus ferrooxydans TaxID=471514 RepID=A0A0N8PPX4_9BACL|nr:DUF58 domain-containing protein [Alicyclobacillus ferrooxydans]KPV45533.1 hypothetical protein AN477_00860 [Alicyclobacillus ferrooxydans]
MVIYAILAATLLVILLQMLIYRWVSLRAVDYTAGFDARRASAGDTIHFSEQIRNQALIPIPWVRVESSFDLSLRFHGASDRQIKLGQQFHQFHYSVFSLARRTQITRRHDVVCSARGVFELDGAVMTTGDLFGLWRSTRHYPVKSEVIVYPRVEAYEDLPLPVSRSLGEMLVRRSFVDDPFMVSGVREYVPGDSLKLINWKATAHTGDVMVHRRDATADLQLMIYLNVEDMENMWNKVSHPEWIEQGIVIAASAAAFAVQHGMRVGFVTNAENATRTLMLTGDAHLEELLDRMARIRIEREIGFERLLEAEIRDQTKNTAMLILTAYVNEDLEAAFIALRRLGNFVHVVNLRELSEQEGKMVR